MIIKVFILKAMQVIHQCIDVKFKSGTQIRDHFDTCKIRYSMSLAHFVISAKCMCRKVT